MSSEKGNVARTRPQKHQNRKVFKNNLHDTNIRTKRINQIQITCVCDKCKAILEWKIKYKKYKLLKAPKSCNKCGEKTVKQAYCTICHLCADQHAVCPKCAAPFRTQKDDNIDELRNVKSCSNDLKNFTSSCDPEEQWFNSIENCLGDSDEEECIDKMSELVLNT